MKRLIRIALTAGASVTVSLTAQTAQARSYSRGPHLPEDSKLHLPGVPVARGGLNGRCQERDLPCDPNSETVLVWRAERKTYELGLVQYSCSLVEDSPAGPLKCTQLGYAVIDTYSRCTATADVTVSPAALNTAPSTEKPVIDGWSCAH